VLLYHSEQTSDATEDAGRHFRRRTQMTHIGHVVFGDQMIFWATVCKTVRSTLSDRCLSVCLSCPVCLSVTLVYYGQTVGLRAE